MNIAKQLNLSPEWVTSAPKDGGYVVGWFFTDQKAGEETVRRLAAEMFSSDDRTDDGPK